MTREERIEKLRHLITCMKCEVSGKPCDNNCPTQYDAGHMGEIIENLEEIAKALEQEPCEDCISRRREGKNQKTSKGQGGGTMKEKCPICEYEFEYCQCRFGGNAHPDRSKRARVVADHIYLITDKQIEHLKKVQKWWSISYGDKEMSQILKELESEEEE